MLMSFPRMARIEAFAVVPCGGRAASVGLDQPASVNVAEQDASCRRRLSCPSARGYVLALRRSRTARAFALRLHLLLSNPVGGGHRSVTSRYHAVLFAEHSM